MKGSLDLNLKRNILMKNKFNLKIYAHNTFHINNIHFGVNSINHDENKNINNLFKYRIINNNTIGIQLEIIKNNTQCSKK